LEYFQLEGSYEPWKSETLTRLAYNRRADSGIVVHFGMAVSVESEGGYDRNICENAKKAAAAAAQNKADANPNPNTNTYSHPEGFSRNWHWLLPLSTQ
jgi:hypothetical protein